MPPSAVLSESESEIAQRSTAAPLRDRLRGPIERVIELGLMLAGVSSIAITFAILYILVSESILFFALVSPIDFVTDTEWTPLFADAHFGIAPLLCGTLLSSGIGLIVAVPLGLVTALYLSEFA